MFTGAVFLIISAPHLVWGNKNINLNLTKKRLSGLLGRKLDGCDEKKKYEQ